MPGVFRNIDPLTPSPPGKCAPRLWWGGGEDTLAGWRGGGGSIVRKTPDTALYSIYVITLCPRPTNPPPPFISQPSLPATVYEWGWGKGGGVYEGWWINEWSTWLEWIGRTQLSVAKLRFSPLWKKNHPLYNVLKAYGKGIHFNSAQIFLHRLLDLC
jgi:hypothetical protein